MNSFKNILIFTVFFYYNFNFYPKVIPHNVCLIIYNAIPIIYLFINYKCLNKFIKIIRYDKGIVIAVIFLLISHLWGVVTVAINDSYDYSFLYTLILVIRGIYINLFLAIIICKNVSENNCLELFIKYYLMSCALYVMTTIAFIINPDLKMIWSNSIHMTEVNLNLAEGDVFGYVTRYGLKGFSGFQETIKCTISVIMLLYIITKIKSRKWVIIGLLSLLGNLFYGRIGVLTSIISLIIFEIITRKIVKFYYARSIIEFVVGIAFIICFVIPEDALNDYYAWLSGPVVAFIDGLSQGHMDFGTSANNVVDWYVLPDDGTFFLGDGLFSNKDGSYYMYTDAGFMRSVYYFGIIGSVFYYLSIILLAFSFLNKHCGKSEFSLFVSSVISFFIVEYKGTSLVNFFPMLFVLSMLINIDKTNKRIRMKK